MDARIAAARNESRRLAVSCALVEEKNQAETLETQMFEEFEEEEKAQPKESRE